MKLFLVALCLAFASAAEFYPAVEEVVEGEYIVVLQDEATIDDLEDYVSSSNDQMLELMFTYSTVFRGFAARMSKEHLQSHISHPLVKFVEENQVMRIAACVTQSRATWGITRVSESKPGELNGNYRYDSATAGKGVTAYIIDTGIYVSNNDFGGRATFAFQASGTGSSTDSNGHGTHVASTVGGTTYGIAKQVTLKAVKVLGDSGTGSTAGVISGVDFAAKDCRGKCVINMSLGGGASQSLDNAVNSAVSRGITTVVAAGNDNRDARNSSPARASGVITVGSVAEGGRSGSQVDERSYFSNYGPALNVFAPGSLITAAWIGSRSATNTISGTSMASPHVAGVAAVLLSTSGVSSSPNNIKNLITGRAKSNIIDLQCSNSVCNASPNKMLYLSCPF